MLHAGYPADSKRLFDIAVEIDRLQWVLDHPEELHNTPAESLAAGKAATTVDLQLAQRIVAFLNELTAIDPEAMLALVESRVPCNAALVGHPTVQVVSGPLPDTFTVGILGILNGLCGVHSNGWGGIAGVADRPESPAPRCCRGFVVLRKDMFASVCGGGETPATDTQDLQPDPETVRQSIEDAKAGRVCTIDEMPDDLSGEAVVAQHEQAEPGNGER
jgi:hypothetical protein